MTANFERCLAWCLPLSYQATIEKLQIDYKLPYKSMAPE